MSQTLPRNVFELLIGTFGEKEKAEQFALGVENLVFEQTKSAKNEIKNELRDELITKELFLVHSQMIEDKFQTMEDKFDERFKMIDYKFQLMKDEFNERFKLMDERFKLADWKTNVLICLVIMFGTFLNPTFLSFLSKLLKI